MNNSNRIFALGSLAFTLLASGSAFATETTVPITSNAFPNKTYSITVVQDAQGKIEKMVYATDSGAKDMEISALQSARQVLYPDHNAIYLAMDSDFNVQKGGHIELEFLTNALTGKYKDFRVLVDVQGDGVVLRSDPNLSDGNSDKNPYSGPFEALYIKKGSFGISGITPGQK